MGGVGLGSWMMQVVAETLESAEHNLEAAIKCLEELRLSATNTQPHQQHQQQPTEMENPRPAGMPAWPCRVIGFQIKSGSDEKILLL